MQTESPASNITLILVAIAAIWLFAKFLPYIVGALIALMILASLLPDDAMVAEAHAGLAGLLMPILLFWLVWVGVRMMFGGGRRRGDCQCRHD